MKAQIIMFDVHHHNIYKNVNTQMIMLNVQHL